jgi:hypothetical protein
MQKNENEINNIDPFKVYVRVRPLLERELHGEVDSNFPNVMGMNINNKVKTAVVVESNQVS